MSYPTVSLSITPEQFSALGVALKADTQDVKTLTLTTPTTGNLTTKDVELDFEYTAPLLTVICPKRLSVLAKFASADTIQAHVSDLLNKFITS